MTSLEDELSLARSSDTLYLHDLLAKPEQEHLAYLFLRRAQQWKSVSVCLHSPALEPEVAVC